MKGNSEETRKRWNEKRKEKRKNNSSFIEMIQKEFPDSKLTKGNFADFIFHLAGYDYDKNFNITKRPSKFGDSWIISSTDDSPVCELVNQNKTSLLLNERLIQLIHKPEKTYQWQNEALQRIFPNYANWFPVSKKSSKNSK